MLETAKDILAAIGLTVLAFGLGWAIGETHAHWADAAAYAPVKAARDSIAKVAVASDSAHAHDVARLDSALLAMAKLTMKRDTVDVPGVHTTDTLPGDTSALAATRDSLERLRAASQQVANACTVVAQDCAKVRAQRDSLLALTAPKAPAPSAADTSARLTADAALLIDPIARIPTARLGASFQITPKWSITAEGDWRITRGDSLRFYVGAVRRWSIW